MDNFTPVAASRSSAAAASSGSLCVLTDGREWSFYVPGGQGSYEDRRVYRLQLDDRAPQECGRILHRYLARDRVRDGSAAEDAQRDYRDAAGKREAVTALPRAWADLMREPEELLIDIVGGKAEALCGFKPATMDVLAFLRQLQTTRVAIVVEREIRRTAAPAAEVAAPVLQPEPVVASQPAEHRSVRFTLFGEPHVCATAAQAMVEILGGLALRDPAKVVQLAEAVRGRSRSMIARTGAEINPARPDLARAAEFAPGWLVGLNLSNRDKMVIIRTACTVFEVRIPEDLHIVLPNAP